ncbi:MAG: cupredoxin domain-containing protein [Chloroflexota bacterium]
MKTLLLSSAVLALALAACGGSGTTAGPATTAPTDAPSTAPSAVVEGQVVIVRDFAIEPLDVTSGTDVTLAVTSEGPTPHNLTIRDDAGETLGATANLSEGGSETLTTKLQPGTYILFCSLGGHESLGMRATLTVEE